MSAKFDEKMVKIGEDLEKLKKKAADVYGDAKAAEELGAEVVQDKINDVKGDLVASRESIRLAGEEEKSKLSSEVLKAQMKLEAKIEDIKTAHDKRKLENYIDDHIIHMADLYETINYLLSDAQLTALETVAAVSEYNEKFADQEEE